MMVLLTEEFKSESPRGRAGGGGEAAAPTPNASATTTSARLPARGPAARARQPHANDAPRSAPACCWRRCVS